MPSLSPSFKCQACGASIQRARSLSDALGYMPLFAAMTIVYSAEEISRQHVWLYLGISVVAGVAVWLPFVRYKRSDIDSPSRAR